MGRHPGLKMRNWYFAVRLEAEKKGDFVRLEANEFELEVGFGQSAGLQAEGLCPCDRPEAGKRVQNRLFFEPFWAIFADN